MNKQIRRFIIDEGTAYEQVVECTERGFPVFNGIRRKKPRKELSMKSISRPIPKPIIELPLPIIDNSLLPKKVDDPTDKTDFMNLLSSQLHSGKLYDPLEFTLMIKDSWAYNLSPPELINTKSSPPIPTIVMPVPI
ncbi:hypothetical protein TVAG_381320 [Trichomonas vaginalis G3]|uniref:Uncharacterized protein n=1 Tax=Trichomonas vaginalis (strain ATCC PRA-98 / G3) TaxID=412133 RepID=A2FKC8_TRIV3|nr:hypothetical protein TVAGG3_0776670 [Trichomonas vaginalis G3]EAX94628.1 hypothetical protein TVAG_381320 [Trichomonas vaginalis G3]KAI5494768.1 hypothetical protein TVAGG3_0776670 [Trichomonas vaginalis G3]|eukprot:XP_001307558.1 hypothetical protein [Trichomonas vaginalis G3]